MNSEQPIELAEEKVKQIHVTQTIVVNLEHILLAKKAIDCGAVANMSDFFRQCVDHAGETVAIRKYADLSQFTN